MSSWALLVVALVLLVGGAEFLVRGAVGLAARFGISPLVIGLTVVAFGTSSPEMAVSLSAVLADRPDIVIGNPVGSNTFNVLFILGISSLVCPLVVAQRLVRIDVPIMIGASGLLWILSLDGLLGRIEGLALFVGIVAYTIGAVWAARREGLEVREEYRSAGDLPRRPSMLRSWLLIVVGLGLAILGARWFVTAAVEIATAIGVSELVIALTVVAAGTSLPEVVTSLVAAMRGQRDIAVGNVSSQR